MHYIYFLGLGAHGGPRGDTPDTELLVKAKNFSAGNGRVIVAMYMPICMITHNTAPCPGMVT